MTSKKNDTEIDPSTDKIEKEEPGFFSFENLRSLGFLVLVIFAIRWSIAAPYHVPTASMEPTIKVGDRLLAWKLAYGFKIPFTDKTLFSWTKVQKGDIIVFRYPEDPSIDYVKRVVGVAGDRIRVIDNQLYVNGKAVVKVDHNFDRQILNDIEDNPKGKNLFKESLESIDHWVIENKNARYSYQSRNFPENGLNFVVPEDSVFAMGDNRDNSTDSRIWGKVPLSYIRGKALFVIWSMYTPPGSSWFDFRFSRFGHMLDNLKD